MPGGFGDEVGDGPEDKADYQAHGTDAEDWMAVLLRLATTPPWSDRLIGLVQGAICVGGGGILASMALSVSRSAIVWWMS